MRNSIRTIFTTVVFLCVAIVGGAATEAVALPDEGSSLWALLAQGGWAMWPLGVCSLVSIALVLHAARETRRARFIPDGLVSRLHDALGRRELEVARTLVAGDRTVLSRALAGGLTRARAERPDANKARVEEGVVEGIEHEDAAIGQWINYLNVVATVAPMIGLLGTVSGMIGAFQSIKGGAMGRPELLAGDIGEALITTATGLVIGIPAMIAYFVLRNRLGNQVMATSQVATRLIDRLAGEGGDRDGAGAGDGPG
jgi:biopolymer transport protein ExbB